MIRHAEEIPYFLERNIKYMTREIAAQSSEWLNSLKDQFRPIYDAQFNSKQPADKICWHVFLCVSSATTCESLKKLFPCVF